jgi:hypothetical protein
MYLISLTNLLTHSLTYSLTRYLIIGPALKRGKVLLERAKQAEQVSYHDEMHSKVNSGGHRSHLHIDTRHPTEIPERSQEVTFPSVAHLLTHSLTYSLTHSLTYLLTI